MPTVGQTNSTTLNLLLTDSKRYLVTFRNPIYGPTDATNAVGLIGTTLILFKSAGDFGIKISVKILKKSAAKKNADVSVLWTSR